jgi:predicted dehydrogenase
MTSSSSTSIRAGLIGYGYAGKTFHAPLLRAVPGIDLSVLGSSNPHRVLADIPGVTVCSAEEAATHSAVDLVVIATPNESHYPLAAAGVGAGPLRFL